MTFNALNTIIRDNLKICLEKIKLFLKPIVLHNIK